MTTTVVLLAAALIPGFLLVDVCTSKRQRMPWYEKLLYAAGAGYSVIVVGMLVLSYLPGPVSTWHILALYVAVSAALLAPVAYRRRAVFEQPQRYEVSHRWRQFWTAPNRRKAGHIAAVTVIVVFTLYFRFTHLGYSELQGDEASVALNADDVVRGYENALLTRTKGPAEILVPALIYRLTDTLTEQQARLPFAVANSLAVMAILLLGSRLVSPLAGFVAAAVVALDGYFIAFGRILQYQSIVFFMVVLTVLVLYRLVREPKNLTGVLILAALFSATGALAHYDAVFVVVPGVYLLWRIARQTGVRELIRAAVLPALFGLALLALFYVPYVLSPSFDNVFWYLFGYRIGGTPMSDSLQNTFFRTTLYSTSYYLYLMVVLATTELARMYLHTLPKPIRIPAVVIMVLFVAILFAYPEPLAQVNHRILGAIMALAIGVAWVSPQVNQEERLIWLWFGVTLIVAVFLSARPDTHVYTVFIPWSLLAGLSVHHIHRFAATRFGPRPTSLVAAGALGLTVVLFAAYAHQLFIRNDVEVLRTWPENRPRGYWTAYEMPVEVAIFGFPLRNGWNSIAALYESGILDGGFDTNVRPQIAEWYTRGRGPCARDDPETYLLAYEVEPTYADERAEIRRQLEDKYELFATIEINGEPHLEIFQRSAASIQAQVLDDSVYSAAAHGNHAGEDFPRNGPIGSVPIPYPMDIRLSNGMRMRGYDLPLSAVLAGESLEVTLYWEATEPIAQDYDISVQVIDQQLRKAGQRDGEPGCNEYPTSTWIAGDIMSDRYRISIAEDAAEGDYTLLATVYSEDGQVDFLDAAGNPAGVEIPLANITVMK